MDALRTFAERGLSVWPIVIWPNAIFITSCFPKIGERHDRPLFRQDLPLDHLGRGLAGDN
jgi:hypothetical protein